MKKKLTCILSLIVIGLIVLTLPIQVVLAAVLATPVNIESNIDITDGMSVPPYRNTFFAEGRHWIFYLNDGTDLVYTSADENTPDTFLPETTIAAGTGLYAFEFGVWYDHNTGYVHYARHEMLTDPDEVKYRMGTPSSDGTITWAAAEQIVSTVPADLVTWRTNISVDESGYPWVFWIDTDNITPALGKLFIRSSSTKNGTWTTDATRTADNISANFTSHVWFVQGSPIGSEGDVMEIEWSEETGAGDQTGLFSVTYNGTGYEGTDTVAIPGELAHDRPWGFSFYDLGSAIHLVYTDSTGAIKYRGRSQIQSWNGTAAATEIKPAGATYKIPSLSGYKSIGAGEDLICIVSDNDSLWYDTKPYGENFTGSWTTIYTVSSTAWDITRHLAAYKYSSPVGFTWQEAYNGGAANDSSYYWWIDNTNDTIGYYSHPTDTGNTLFRNLIPIILASSIALILAYIAYEQEDWKLLLAAGVGGTMTYFAVTTLISLLF